MSNISFRALKWAAEECERQQSGEISVYNMAAAYSKAHDWYWKGKSLDEMDILLLASLIDSRNERGYRTCLVRLPGMDFPVDYCNIPQNMQIIIKYQPTLGDKSVAKLWYRQFEEIHPFIDGNGRLGSLLFNYHSGTLLYPVRPPDFWS